MRKQASGIVLSLMLLSACAGQSVGATTSVIANQLQSTNAAINAYCTEATAQGDTQVMEICAQLQPAAAVTLPMAQMVLDAIEMVFRKRAARMVKAEPNVCSD